MKGADLPVYGQVSPRATEVSKNPHHEGPLGKFNGHARTTGPCCDTMEFWLQISKDRIVDASFTTSGCGSSRAAGSMATEIAIGKRLTEAAEIDQADILAALGGLPEKSEHCDLLAANTLKAAIEDFTSRKSDELRELAPSEPTGHPSRRRRHDESHDNSHRSQTLARRTVQRGCGEAAAPQRPAVANCRSIFEYR